MTLTYETGTNYRAKSVELTTGFDLDVLFGWAVEQSDKPKRTAINLQLTTLMDVKPSNYAKASELTESAEFHAACDMDGRAHVIALKKSGRVENENQQGARGGITNDLKKHVGEQVLEFALDGVDIETHVIDEQFCNDTVSQIRELLTDYTFTTPKVKPISEKPVGKRKQVDANLAASVKALAAGGMDASQIANVLPHADVDMVNEILNA